MKKSIDDFILPHLGKVKPYQAADPLEQMIESTGIPADRIIRLNANENPYGASPKVAEALATLQTHIYPDPLQRRARSELARYVGTDESRVIAGAGSDELIDMLLRLFISPGDRIIECDPTFGMYSFYGRIVGAEVRAVPRDDAFEIEPGAVTRAVDSRTKMVFLNSPNNPTGNPASEEQVRSILGMGLVVVVDEAYYEFSGQTAAGLVPEHENLVVLRTFSKWAGIAGLRVGYGVMSPRLVERIIDMKSPFNLNTAGEAAMLASLADADALLEKVALIVAERERMFATLDRIEGVRPLPSDGNYILCEFQPGRAAAVFEGLIKRGIFVRKFSHPRLKDHFRVSIGTPEQNNAVTGAVAELV